MGIFELAFSVLILIGFFYIGWNLVILFVNVCQLVKLHIRIAEKRLNGEGKGDGTV